MSVCKMQYFPRGHSKLLQKPVMTFIVFLCVCMCVPNFLLYIEFTAVPYPVHAF